MEKLRENTLCPSHRYILVGFYRKHMEEMSDIERANFYYVRKNKVIPMRKDYANEKYGDREIINITKEGNIYKYILLDHIRTEPIKPYKIPMIITVEGK